MSYTVNIAAPALGSLEHLPGKLRRSIEQRLLSLEDNPRPRGALMLKGERHSGWRIRAGMYRILYQIDDSRQQVDVYFIGPRDQAYR
jgi:mRNA interferase RelE/StbE